MCNFIDFFFSKVSRSLWFEFPMLFFFFLAIEIAERLNPAFPVLPKELLSVNLLADLNILMEE